MFSVQQTSLSQRTPNIEHGTVPKQDSGPELTFPPPREAALFTGGMHYGPWPLLPNIHCPVLALEGARSTKMQLHRPGKNSRRISQPANV